MDYNQYNQDPYTYHNSDNDFQQSAPPQHSRFATASMVCGILSFVFCSAGLSLPLGALGILFSILTYRKGQPLNSTTRTGIVTSSIGLLFGLIISIYSLMNPITKDPAFQESLYNSLEEVYGEDVAEYIMDLYEFDSE